MILSRRNSKIKILQWSLALTFLLVSAFTLADEINVAVASNFSDVVKEIAKRFKDETGHKVILALGSTGKHYAQIHNGAPFDIFLAADSERPILLEKEGIALSGSRFTYAVGKLVLWSPVAGVVDENGNVLNGETFHHLAIANPKLAPYGKAAEQVMRGMAVWDKLQRRIVRGQNIGQAYQFIESGNAELGFIAFSQIKAPDRDIAGSFWEPSQSLYNPVEQQAVQLRENKAAHDFLDYMKSEKAREIIREYGYGLP